MTINALNIEILIQHQEEQKMYEFSGTLTSFLYEQISQCKSLLLIYDWHQIA